MYLIDTDILINHLRKVSAINPQLLKAGMAISIITLAELYYGVYRSDNPQSSLDKIDYALTTLNLEIINLDLDIIDQFAQLKSLLEQSGQRLEDFDLLIASTALSYNLTLVTGNVKHYQRINSLKIYQTPDV